ncbi:uncharacterized protein LOC118422910 [Branchiostoma floridae]|uniref:Uncharacterized protein LOC118422910 n=1 Tax=Branchiostoma floridae TaxID=7739 RepID=A0A9J7LSW7_BRAFL|nr:uncharacterized protein LOC118422910 [Branchiostoma floridae]
MTGKPEVLGVGGQHGEKYSPTYEDHVQAGETALKLGEFDRAEKHFASALKLVHHQFTNPQIVAVLQALGSVYHARVKNTLNNLTNTNEIERNEVTFTENPLAVSEEVASTEQNKSKHVEENEGQETKGPKLKELSLDDMEQTGTWTVNAAALYNSAIVRSKQEKQIKEIKASIQNLEELFLQCTVGGQKEPHSTNRAFDPRGELLQIREECQKKLDDLDTIPYDTEHELHRAEAIRGIYSQIAADISGLIRSMVEASIQDLGEPPCKYAIIGLGSLAREETTPYSDFEFAILLEEGGDGTENRQYFRNLTRLLHLKVLDLGETILPAVAIKSLNDFYSDEPGGDWFYDVGPRGFAFDGAMPGASKTPIGRPEVQGKPALELIRTPKNMAILQTPANAEKYGFHVDNVLRTVAYVAGDRKLVEEYESLVQQILLTRKPSAHPKPSLEINSNKGGSAKSESQVSRTEQQTLGVERAKTFLEEILHSYKSTLKEDEDGKLFQVKKELYRLPSMVVNGLGLFYALEAKTAWDIIEEMADKGLLTKVALQNLKVAVSIATELRLRTYLSNDSQSDDITPMKRIDQVKDVTGTGETCSREVRELTNVLPKNVLVRFYQTLLPLEKTMSVVVQKPEDEDPTADSLTGPSLSEDCLLDTSTRTKCLILLRLSQYQEAISSLEEEIHQVDTVCKTQDPDMIRHLGACHYNLGNAYRGEGDNHKAKEHYQQALVLWRQEVQSRSVQEYIAHALHALGHIYHVFNKFDQAVQAYEEALTLRKHLYGKGSSDMHPFISDTLHGMALLYRDTGDYQEALKLENQALRAAKEMYGQHRAHADTATFLSGLGSIHREMANFNMARESFQEALRMLQSVLGENVAHPKIATALTALANVDGQLQGFSVHCLSKYFKALQIYHILHGTEGKTQETAVTLHNIGNCLDDLGHLQDSEKYHRDSLNMFLHIYGNADNLRVADSYSDLGGTLLQEGKSEEGLEMMEKALQMRQAVFQGREAPEIASSIANLGYAHWTLGNIDKATQYTEEAVAMATNLHKVSKLHPSIIMPMQTLGVVYMERKEWKSAKEIFEKVLEMEQTIYSGPHPLVAQTLCNMGAVHTELLDYKTALNYLQRAESVSEDVFGQDAQCPQVALILNNMGIIYMEMGNIPQAREYLTRSLEMKVAIYGEDIPHPDIGATLCSMGNLMSTLGNIDMAVTCFEKALKNFRGSYGNKNHPSISGALDSLGAVLVEKGDYHESLRCHREALELKRQMYGEKSNAPIAQTLNNLGNVYKSLGEHETALSLYQQSLDIYEDVHGKGTSHPKVAQGLVGVGNQYVNLGKHQEGIQLLLKALKILEEFYGVNTPHPDIASCLNNVAFAHGKLKEFDCAIQCYQRALEVWRQLFGNEHPNVAMTLHNLGSEYFAAGDATSAMVHYEEAVKIYQLYPCNPHAHLALFNFARFCLQQGNKAKALENYIEGINALQLLPGDVSLHPELVTGLNSAALILLDGNSYKEAAAYWEKALAAYSQMRTDPTVDVGKMQFNLARCYGELGEVEKECSFYEQALQTRLLQQGENSTDVGLFLLHIAKAVQKAGNHQQSLKYLQQAADMFRVLTTPDSKMFLAAVYKGMRETYQSMGDQANAAIYLAEMMRTLQSTNQEVEESIFDELSLETKSLLEKFPGLRPSLKQAATTVKMLEFWRNAKDLNGAALLIWTDLVLPRRTMSKPELQLFGHFLADIGTAEQFHSYIRFMETSYGDVISNNVTFRCLVTFGELCVSLADSSALMCQQLVTAGMVAMFCGWLENFQKQYPQDKSRSSLVTIAIHTIHNCCKVSDVRAALKDQNISCLMAPYLKVEDMSTRLAAVLVTSYLSDDDETPQVDTEILDGIIDRLDRALQEDSRSFEGYSALELVMGIGTLCGNTANRTAFLERSAAALVEKLMKKTGDKEEASVATSTICTLLAD